MESEYDAADRLVQRTLVAAAEGVIGPTSESYGYDGLSRLIAASSGGVASSFRYDSLSRLVEETTAGRRVRYELDAVGNPQRTEYPSGLQVTQAFDALDRPLSVAMGTDGTPGSLVASYGYQGPYLRASKGYGSGQTATSTFDADRRLLSQRLPGPDDATVFEEALRWRQRPLRDLQERKDLNGAGMLLGYDAASRLTAAAPGYHGADEPRRLDTNSLGANSLGANSLATKDLAGLPSLLQFAYETAQRLSEYKSTEDGIEETSALAADGTGRNRPATAGDKTFRWDRNGNLIGKLAGDDTRQYAYDFRNRLTQVKDASGQVLATYAYDALNRRVRRTLHGQPMEETVWAGWREAETYSGGALASRHVYGAGLDEIVASEVTTAGASAGEQTYFPVYDSTGNLVMMTNEAGKPVERYLYTPFGIDKLLADTTPPRLEQLRRVGAELWLEASEEVQASVLLAAKQAGDVALEKTGTGEAVPFELSQPVLTGPAGGRRLVLSFPGPAGPPEDGTVLTLTLPAAAVQDTFLNPLAADFTQTFTWHGAGEPTMGAVYFDETAPLLLQAVVRDRHVELTFSEEVSTADLSALAVDGEPSNWTLDATRYRLTSDLLLDDGEHSVSLGTQVQDLAEHHLADAFFETVTLAEGTVSKRFYRAPNPSELTATEIGSRHFFHGRTYDPETQFFYFRNRYYDADMCQFTTADPLGYVDGPSMYAFAGNDPVNGGDPLGLACRTEHGGNNPLCNPTEGHEYHWDTPAAVYAWEITKETLGNSLSQALFLNTIADTPHVALDPTATTGEKVLALTKGGGAVAFDVAGGAIISKGAGWIARTRPAQYLLWALGKSRLGQRAASVLTEDVSVILRWARREAGAATEAVGEVVPGAVPRGFSSGGQFEGALTRFRSAAAVDDAVIGVRGSAATGVRHGGGPFGPASDIDFFIVSDELFSRGVAAGARHTGGALRVGDTLRYFPELATVEGQLTQELGRKTTIRVFSRRGFEGIKTGSEIF